MNAVIDLGNSSSKLAFFKNNSLESLYRDVSFSDILFHVKNITPEHAIICSVNQDPSVLKELIQDNLRKVYVLEHLLPVPLTNHYLTPHTLGKDRLAAVCGAKTLFPDQNCLAIDIGTCITYDYIDAENNYFGGCISPGLHMRLKALHTFTSRLPLVEPIAETPLIGRNTQEAILSGVINGMTAELEGIIQKFRKKFSNVHVIFCGGDAGFFESKIKERIFVIPELVLIGLNRILEYNVSTI
jgi:type III pantothenate kinase